MSCSRAGPPLLLTYAVVAAAVTVAAHAVAHYVAELVAETTTAMRKPQRCSNGISDEKATATSEETREADELRRQNIAAKRSEATSRESWLGATATSEANRKGGAANAASSLRSSPLLAEKVHYSQRFRHFALRTRRRQFLSFCSSRRPSQPLTSCLSSTWRRST